MISFSTAGRDGGGPSWRERNENNEEMEEDGKKRRDSERPVGSWNASARNKISIPRALIEPGYVFPCGIGGVRCLPLPISRSLDFKPAETEGGERGGRK